MIESILKNYEEENAKLEEEKKSIENNISYLSEAMTGNLMAELNKVGISFSREKLNSKHKRIYYLVGSFCNTFKPKQNWR